MADIIYYTPNLNLVDTIMNSSYKKNVIALNRDYLTPTFGERLKILRHIGACKKVEIQHVSPVANNGISIFVVIHKN